MRARASIVAMSTSASRATSHSSTVVPSGATNIDARSMSSGTSPGWSESMASTIVFGCPGMLGSATAR